MSNHRYRRRPTREVMIGDVGVGGSNPIRIQSMTTAATTDIAGTVAQIAALVEAGCEIVRLTVPSSRDAEAIAEIRTEMKRLSLGVPLVADIHFSPATALKVAEHVEKIRINPGNYADKKKFKVIEYSDAEYDSELERIETVFSPLVTRCRELGIPIRIGTNHGSLSDRIMNRYGDTPEGMVESALEFVRICESHSFREIVLSMKASNPVVVLDAYRLLATRMDAENMPYPLHLGVTEAGGGEDARIKSAIGIGTLLEEGLGDTIRVSLTEDPVAEIPVARELAARFRSARPGEVTPDDDRDTIGYEPVYSTRRHRRESARVTFGPQAIGGTGTILVELPLSTPLSDMNAIYRTLEEAIGTDEDTCPEVVSVDLDKVDGIDRLKLLKDHLADTWPRMALSARLLPGMLQRGDRAPLSGVAEICDRLHWTIDTPPGADSARNLEQVMETCSLSGTSLLVETVPAGRSPGESADAGCRAASLARDKGFSGLMLAAGPDPGTAPLMATRLLSSRLASGGFATPVVLLDRPGERGADPLLAPSGSLGGLLCEGIGDAIHVDLGGAAASVKLSFSILQAARVRITRTEFISCPSCGRTLFDLESTTERIRKRTSHLKGLKIGIMGCIVNGPGEMADADFGYVGWGKDKIALFVGREMVARDIPVDEAEDRLVELIREHGRWIDPPAAG